jgi:hypothetical protein
MPTAPLGPWYNQAIAKGLIDPTQFVRPAMNAVTLAAVSRGLSPLLDPPPPDASEKQFQTKVLALAEYEQWEVYHTHNSRRSQPGWPDLALVKPPSMILADLKTDTGRTTEAQEHWLELLRQVPGVRVRLWRPSLWAAVVAELTAVTLRPDRARTARSH